MFKITKAALCAALMLSASNAGAATYYDYTFSTFGYGVITSSVNGPEALTYTSLNNVIINFKVLASRPFYQTPDGGFGTAFTIGGFSSTNEGVRFSYAPVFDQVQDDLISANACFANPAGGPPPVFGDFVTDRACSSASIETNDNRFFRTSYKGTVSLVSVRAIEGDFFEGASFVNGVPEPSTWALMLAGFGLVGYAMRRRAKVAFA